jgi:hypothetical protein
MPQRRKEYRQERDNEYLKAGEQFIKAGSETMDGPLRILSAYESFVVLHPDWPDERMMQGFFGWMAVEGYSPSTMRLYAETITSMHVRPDNVGAVRSRLLAQRVIKGVLRVAGRAPFVDKRSGITAELLGRYLRPLAADDRKQTEYRAFFYLLVSTGNRPRHIRETRNIKIEGGEVCVMWNQRKAHGQMRTYLRYSCSWTAFPDTAISAFIKGLPTRGGPSAHPIR